MGINLGPDLQAALNEAARQQGIEPEALIVTTLRDHFLPTRPFQPQDDWERLLLDAASDCGVSLPDSAVSSEELYD